VFADITVPVSGDVEAVLHGDYCRQAPSFGAPRSFNSNGSNIPRYALANFRVGLQNDSAGWSLTANRKNAFDKTYYAGVFALGELYQVNSRIVGERRTFTLEARYKF
jgi:iron complex outermembrane receptor protein